MPIETSTGPEASSGFGGREAADATRQAQQSFSNDTPTDVNMNAIIARVQGGTMALMAANFEANADRRNKIFDALAPKILKD